MKDQLRRATAAAAEANLRQYEIYSECMEFVYYYRFLFLYNTDAAVSQSVSVGRPAASFLWLFDADWAGAEVVGDVSSLVHGK